MPKVLIVEDEPAAARYLRSMIELKRPGFSVVGVAANGRIALEEIRRVSPDLVITDVKMPVMDGIEFVTELKKCYPALPAVIVSGYQEFEYARRALATGVVDYLLKPVDPIQLVEVLDRLGSLLSSREGERRVEALVGLIKGEAGGAEGPVSPDERFHVAVDRVGGLPSRFRPDLAGLGGAVRENGCCILPGRDSRERILLGSTELISRTAFIEFAAAAGQATGESFRTVLILPCASSADGLRQAVREAYLTLDKLIVVGVSQVHYLAATQLPEMEWDRPLADRIEFALRGSRTDLLEKAIRGMVEAWRVKRMPLLSVEFQLRRILHLVLRKAPHANESVAVDLEFLLEEALSSSNDFEELSDSAWSLVAKAAGLEGFESSCTDVPGFFHAIMRYVEGQYSEQLNLGSLSAIFRISPSYLSKLFRQHAGRSFGEFLSAVRIDAAKRLIRENPDMPLKDVAERVGFVDPFYFSRVFKSVVGQPPSDYSRLGKDGMRHEGE